MGSFKSIGPDRRVKLEQIVPLIHTSGVPRTYVFVLMGILIKGRNRR